MSAADSPKKPSKSKRAEKRVVQPKSNPNERLKAIVRRLPPNLPEDIFWKSVHNWISNETVAWKFFYAGKLRKKANKENIHSRAYIAFKTEELVAKFSREYDGHIFRDKAGNESQAVVEFAPYQKIPPLEKKKPDNRVGTIDKDDDYVAFLQALESSATKPYDAEQLLENLIASTAPQPQPTSTPLLEALKAEKSAQKDKETIFRNHPHYKDVASKKEDGKKKGSAAVTSGKAAPDSAAPLGKKAAKKTAAAQKAAQAQTKSGASSSTALPANKASAASTPKSGRGARQQQQQQQQAQPNQPGPTTASAPNTPTPAADATTPTVATLPNGSGRRARPMLGLASRQFEAALSGVGAQKAKRERQQGGDASEPPPAEKGKDKASKPMAEASRMKLATATSVTPVAPPPQAGMLPAPAILQREAKQVQRGAGVAGSLVDGGSTRGSGKGRGKGRGRGGGAIRGG